MGVTDPEADEQRAREIAENEDRDSIRAGILTSHARGDAVQYLTYNHAMHILRRNGNVNDPDSGEQVGFDTFTD